VAKKPVIQHCTVALDKITRVELEEIMNLSRMPRTISAVIRGMTAKYRGLLKKQCEAEASGGRVELHTIGEDGEIPVEVLDVRL